MNNVVPLVIYYSYHILNKIIINMPLQDIIWVQPNSITKIPPTSLVPCHSSKIERVPEHRVDTRGWFFCWDFLVFYFLSFILHLSTRKKCAPSPKDRPLGHLRINHTLIFDTKFRWTPSSRVVDFENYLAPELKFISEIQGLAFFSKIQLSRRLF